MTLWLGEPGTLRQLFRLSAATLTAAFALLLVSFVAGGARLLLLLRLADARVNIWRTTRAYVLGLFAAALTPSGGGNGIAIGLALQRDGVKANVAWSAAIYSAVLDLFFYVWSIPLGSVLLYRQELISRQLLWVALAISVLFLALWYGLAYQLQRLQLLLTPLFALPLLRRWRRHVTAFLADVSGATRTMAGGRLTAQVPLHLLSLVLHGGTFAIFYVLAAALGSPLGLAPTLALMLLISAAGHVVPTPGGSGYFEVTLTYAFTQRGAQSGVAAAVVAFRALTFYAPIVLGAVLGGTVLVKELSRGQKPDEA
jgi:uncharacterized protein (TIRG00374 family)